ncbi:MAG: DNA translocase FtsK [Deltaproteobacteria bacterium]|nr:DNA translocase FtsK [Deltaproteobacteria bacterium]MBW2067358.1 DNA translocase FtsK [Deltaproteobacteria bacterium]
MERKKSELLGLIFFFLATLSLISLLSFDPTDPTIFNASSLNSTVHNLLGLFGAHLAWLLYTVIGIASFFIPGLLYLIGYRQLKRTNKGSARNQSIIALGLALIFISLVVIPPIITPVVKIRGTSFPVCGHAGKVIANLLIKTFSRTGALFVTFGLVILGFVALLPWTLSETGPRLAQMTSVVTMSLVRFCKSLSENIRAKLNKARPSSNSAAHSNSNSHISEEALLDIEVLDYDEEPVTMSSKSKVTPQEVEETLFSVEDQSFSHVTIQESFPKKLPDTKNPKKQKAHKLNRSENDFYLPDIGLLNRYSEEQQMEDIHFLKRKAEILTQKLADFGIKGEVVDIHPGPVITMFEYVPAPGIKINRIVNLANDLTMALKAMSIRIVAPIPGKAAVGIEIPNKRRQLVPIRSIIESNEFQKATQPLTIALGKDTVGRPVVTNLARMPHLLIAGATGTGKSVCLNSILCSLLFRNKPNCLKLLLIDPKRIELSFYEGIPHLIHPVVTDVKKATQALRWAVSEMENRYELIAETNARNIEGYNKAIAKMGENGEYPHMPYVVIIIDELADLMMVASRDVEESITRLAQMARAAGIHLILATQRPSVDVITGLIKANIPSRISFQVSSKVDSRTILDTPGAETLLGAGDMLFLPPGTAKLQRIHGAYISEEEVRRVTNFWRQQAEAMQWEHEHVSLEDSSNKGIDFDEMERDEKYEEAVRIVLQTRQASISMLQRRLRVGYNRAARMIEMMEQEGIVGPSDGVKPRQVLLPPPEDN